MRPTARMRSHAPLKQRKDDADATNHALGPDMTFVAERRRQAVRALEQTRKEAGEGSVKKALNEGLLEAERSVSGKPAGEPGMIIARIVGLPGKREPAVPLRGLLLRLKVREKIVAEAETDLFGIGIIATPKDFAGP